MVKKAATADKRLRRTVLRKTKEEPAQLPFVTSPKLFAHIQGLVEYYLVKEDRSYAATEHIGKLAFAFRMEALQRFGHDTAETILLAKMLQPRKQWVRIPRVDAITHIQKYKRISARLDAYQEGAAEQIKAVWVAHSKYLTAGGRDYEKVGGGRSQILHPLDVFDDELWRHYREVYQPWLLVAAKLRLGPQINVAMVTTKILVEDFWPEEVDAAFGLSKGTALKALKAGLAHYWKPEGMEKALFPPPPPKAPGKAGPLNEDTSLPAGEAGKGAKAGPAGGVIPPAAPVRAIQG